MPIRAYAWASVQPNAAFSWFFRPSVAPTVLAYMSAPPPKSNGIWLETSMFAFFAFACWISRMPCWFGPVGHHVVLELVGVLDVDVDRLEAERVDHLLVRAGQCLRRRAVRAELVAAPAADRRDDVAAGRADRRDGAGVRAAGQSAAAVPGRVAAAAGQHER